MLEIVISQEGIKESESWDKKGLGGWEIISRTAKKFQELEREKGMEYLTRVDKRKQDGLASSPGGGGGFYYLGLLMKEGVPVRVEYKKIGQSLETRIWIKPDPLFKKFNRKPWRLLKSFLLWTSI